jgi:hypothetical protein
MTTISGSTTALSSLTSLYASESGSSATDSTKADGGLTSDQVANLVSLAEGNSGSNASGLSALLGQSTTSPGDLNSIIDAIQAQTAGAASDTASDSDTAKAPSTATDQQKAAAMMQSIYQTQQANLFTLLG